MEAEAKRVAEEAEALKQVVVDKDTAILQSEQEKNLLQAQLDILLKVDLTIINKQHLKILELQPTGKLIAPTYCFPSTKEHFNLLKSLGSDRTFSSLTTRCDKSSKPYNTAGVEIFFKNG
jgi:hypothetical protein